MNGGLAVEKGKCRSEALLLPSAMDRIRNAQRPAVGIDVGIRPPISEGANEDVFFDSRRKMRRIAELGGGKEKEKTREGGNFSSDRYGGKDAKGAKDDGIVLCESIV
ncbi:hypothetical protein ACLOJK_020789 [Asimina triloba]